MILRDFNRMRCADIPNASVESFFILRFRPECCIRCKFFVAGFFERIRKWSQLNGRCIALSGVESLLEHSMNFCKYLSTCAFVFGKWKKSDLSTKPFKLDSHSNNVSFGTKEANFSFFFFFIHIQVRASFPVAISKNWF